VHHDVIWQIFIRNIPEGVEKIREGSSFLLDPSGWIQNITFHVREDEMIS